MSRPAFDLRDRTGRPRFYATPNDEQKARLDANYARG